MRRSDERGDAAHEAEQMRTTRLVLLPGMDGTGILFEPVLELLPAHFEAKVVSYPVNEPCGYKDLLDIVRAAFPADGPFVLVGESFSGPLAIMAADARPRALQGVVLCASFVRSPAPWFVRFSDVLVTPSTIGMAPAYMKRRLLMGDEATPRLFQLFSRAEALVSPEVISARIKATLRVDVSDELRRCPVPLLYLRAALDRLVPARCSALIAKCKPDSQIVTLAAPHLLLQTNPADAIAAIARFIENC